MKNMNSFKSISRAIEYEIQRQSEVLDNGGIIEQETLRWDDVSGRTFSMRNKEDAQDYRYFPEPDLVAIKLSDEYIENIRKHFQSCQKAEKQDTWKSTSYLKKMLDYLLLLNIYQTCLKLQKNM